MSFNWAKEYKPGNPLMQWLDQRLPLPRFVYSAVGGGYPVPRNLNYMWNFGVLAGFALVLQIVTALSLRCTTRRMPEWRSTASSTSCAT